MSGYRPAPAFANTLDSITSRQISSVRRAAKRHPDDGEARARLGLALAIRGDLKEAEAALLKARVAKFRGPLVGRAYNNVGDHYRQRNEVDQAVDAYNRADRVGKDPVVRAYAKTRLLECYRARGDTRRAQQVARALARLKGAPQEYVDRAKEFLEG
ncbi:MAG: tetratricopeptide repeat protein [Phycisphaerae bacterium]